MKIIVIFERTFKAQTAKTGVRKAMPLVKVRAVR